MFTFLLAGLLAIDPTTVAMARVRPTSDMARALVATASARSPTVKALLRELEASDLFIYVDLRPGGGDVRAETMFLAANAAGRFLRVSIDAKVDPRRRMELLGHELRHAMEIAGSPHVRDGAGMRTLFRAIGWSMQYGTAFETDAAVDVERQVRRELSQARLMPDAGRDPAQGDS